MGSDVTYVELSDASSKATIGLYAGMEPQELELLVRAALQHPNDVCRGFQVTYEPSSSFRSNRYKKRPSSVMPRLVPLSVACQVPQLLVGHVTVLFMPSATSQKGNLLNTETEQVQQMVQSFETDHKSALLRHFHDEPMLQDHESSTSKKPQFNDLETTKKVLYMELMAKKVVSIGMKSSSLQVQIQILALADDIRQQFCKSQVMKYHQFIETMKLLAIIEKLLDKHMLSEKHGANLLELIVNEDKVLWKTLQSYSVDDGDNMVDLNTIAKRLSVVGCEPVKPISSKKNKGKSLRKGIKQGNWLVKKRGRNAFGTSEMDLVTSLHAQHLLTSLELDILKALIEQEDYQVLQILRVFKQSDYGDVKILRNALVSIVEEITMELGDEEKAAAAFARGMDDAVREVNQLEDSDDNSGSFEWQRHLSFLLGQWQTQQQLTSADVTALLQMVNQRHNLLESAYEVFAGDGDENELLDTLQRVAKLQRQIEQCQGEQIGLDGAPASGLNLEDVVRAMQQRGVLQSGDAAGLLVLFHGKNEALQAANEAFHADGDVHELEDTLLLVVKHARFGREKEEDEPVDEMQAILQLLADFGTSKRLDLWQIQLLISLLKSHDPRLLAAIDVYREDQDTTELADTLEILVELAAWERHCRAMVVDWIPALTRCGKLPRDRAERLVQMVKARDDRVVAALVVFLSDNNKEEFVDTLVRIASLLMKLTDAETDEMKEGQLVLASLNELEENGAISVEKPEEELVRRVEPRMLAEKDVLAATNDAVNVADPAHRDLAKVNDQVKDGIVGEKWEFEEVNLSSKAAVSSIDAELAANKQESGETLDGDTKDDESDAQVLEESHVDIPAGAEVQEERRPNELEEQHETDQVNEIEQKEGHQENDADESSTNDSVDDEDESTKSDVKKETDIVVDVNDEVDHERT
ncbi:hypothetical protein DD238_007846 [Peronospora effusa]|uniref:Uncharacterized protein n=1 Tax=Peronospora effusa TaxID=542832 RepID=A0A3M6V797_9STRA|nr:hypothetical protein DD238_007846 [Peronospora effusa]RQM16883.1 hypothetical protein DD237_004882 [Peronospora effusa]